MQKSSATINQTEKVITTRRLKTSIIRAYDNFIIRAYCYIRFVIMNMRILEEIEQHLPPQAIILDVGCGFGLFSLFFARRCFARKLIAFDIDPVRIAVAQKARDKLNLTQQINFYEYDVADYPFTESVDAIVMLDLFHHLPPHVGQKILASFYDTLRENGTLIIKDVTATPRWQMWFTWLLDKLMNFHTFLYYYTRDEMITLLEHQGFTVKFHRIPDVLPYPHILYICRKKTRPQNTGSVPHFGRRQGGTGG